MASGIAHDINNTLAPIALYAEALSKSELAAAEPSRRYLNNIAEAVKDIEQVTLRLKSFYKPGQEAERAAVDIGQVVASAVEISQPRWKDMPNRRGVVISMITEVPPGLPPVMGNVSELREAVVNLILNAADAMPEGGTIWLRAFIRTGRVTLEIVDTGIGMDAEQLGRCLEPFYTTKGEKGSGLGLVTVRAPCSATAERWRSRARRARERSCGCASPPPRSRRRRSRPRSPPPRPPRARCGSSTWRTMTRCAASWRKCSP